MENEPATPFEVGCHVCGDSSERLRRGLCQKHYRRFARKMASISDPQQAVAFEQMCIDKGWVDEKQAGPRPTDSDPFDALIAEVQAEFEADISAAVARDEKQQAIDAAKQAAKGKSGQPGRRKAN